MDERSHEPKFVHVELPEGALSPTAYTHRLPVGERHTTSRGVEINVSEVAVEILGPHGRLISHSKSWYHDRHPDHEVFFNGCIFSSDGTEIWFGDLDITLERDKLEQLASKIGTIYVTPERPFRWDGLAGRENDDRVIRIPGAGE